MSNADLEGVETALRERLRTARQAHDAALTAFAHPYSGHDAEVEFHYSRGFWSGIAAAMEVVQGQQSGRQEGEA